MKMFEQYQDKLARLFPNDDPSADHLAKNVTFQVTDGCNLACTYCYQINKHNNFMPFETAKKFIDMLLTADADSNEYVNPKECAGVIIEFIGGEPFLAIDLIDEITDYFIKTMIEMRHPWATRYMISICSNGLLYFDPRVQKYIRKHLHHLSFSISIDGNKELHDSCRVDFDGDGSYDIAMKGVRHFIDVLGGSMGSKMTLAPQNVHHTYKAAVSLIENGYREINLNCVYEEGWVAADALVLYEQLKMITDYLLENGFDDTNIYMSIFVDTFFRPKEPSDVQNWCFKAGTSIMSPIGNIFIEDIKEGDEVISASGQCNVVSKIMKKVTKETATLHASGIFETETTLDHPYFAKKFAYIGNKGIYKYLDPQWVEAKDLSKGDKIALFKHKFGKSSVDNSLAYIIGRYIGDGWNSITGYKICCAHEEVEELEAAFKLANLNYSIDDYPTVKQFNIFKNNTELIKYLSEIGDNASEKNIPASAFDWIEENVRQLVKGYLAADGYFDIKKDMQTLSTVSPKLANDLLIILRALGYMPTCYICKRAGESKIQGRDVVIKDRYEVYYHLDSNRSRFCKYSVDDDIIWTTVRNVDKENKEYEVFNLTVENEHSYIANGAIVHNCGGNGRMISMDYKGDIYPCIRYMESSLGDDQEPMIVGNVDRGLVTTQKEKDFNNCLKCIDRRTQSTDECFDCPIAEGCSWCTAYNYQVFGTPDKRAIYICIMHKARALANWYHWAKFYKKQGRESYVPHIPDEMALEVISQEELDMLKSL